MITIRRCCLLFAAGACAVSAGVQAVSIVNSKHNLANDGTVQICVFCHTPHGANQQEGLGLTPLWNRKITNPDAFTPYSSPTMTQTCPTRPTGVSMVCLSCHDGTQADNNQQSAVYNNDQHTMLNEPGDGTNPDFGWGAKCDGACHFSIDPNTGLENIYSVAITQMAGPDLSNDHPISIFFPSGNSFYKTPPDPDKGWNDVKLFNGRVECPSCHNVHDPQFTPFLRKSNAGSQLCTTCHNK